MPDPHGSDHWAQPPGGYLDWQRRMLAAFLEPWLPWLLPDDRAWPPRDRIDAWVAPRWTETARRARIARSTLRDAWLYLGDAAAACRDAVRVMLTGRYR